MPLAIKGALASNLNFLVFIFEIWREIVSGQYATIIGCFLSKKCLIGFSSSLEIFFSFPLLIAPSVFLTNDQHIVRNVSFF